MASLRAVGLPGLQQTSAVCAMGIKKRRKGAPPPSQGADKARNREIALIEIGQFPKQRTKEKRGLLS